MDVAAFSLDLYNMKLQSITIIIIICDFSATSVHHRFSDRKGTSMFFGRHSGWLA